MQHKGLEAGDMQNEKREREKRGERDTKQQGRLDTDNFSEIKRKGEEEVRE